jgi:hypothetical protein
MIVGTHYHHRHCGVPSRVRSGGLVAFREGISVDAETRPADGGEVGSRDRRYCHSQVPASAAKGCVPRFLSRSFTADEIDAAKRGRGVTRDLARSARAHRDQITAMRAQGVGVCEIARRLGLGRKSVARVIARKSP